MADERPVCAFCPVDKHVWATRTYTDPQRHVYHLCQRHYWPIQVWLTKQGDNASRTSP